MSGGDSIFIPVESRGRVYSSKPFVKVLKAVSWYRSENKTVIEELYDLCMMLILILYVPKTKPI